MRSMSASPGRSSQSGAALVIGLVLLVILTLLALTGMNTATTELAMAGNEQFRRNAALAANTGIEQAIAGIGAVPVIKGAAPTVVAPTLVTGTENDRYETSTRYVDDETGLPQNSADKFIGYHYVIESTGTAARNARDQQEQGVFVVASAGGANAPLGQIGTGLP